MVTMVQRLAICITICIISVLLAMAFVYHKGYSRAELECIQQKNDLIIQHEAEKNEIIAKIHKKSPVERRKELSRYVIY